MTNLDYLGFFAQHDVAHKTETIYPSERFKTAGLPFKITVMSQEAMNEYRQMASKQNKRTGVETLDPFKFNTLVVLNHVTQPDFRNVADMKQMNCATPQQYLEKALLPGEIANLANAISELSGFGMDVQKATARQAKN
mgnify:CR=1 FL=1